MALVGPSSVFHFSFYHRVAPFLQDAVLTLNQGGLVGSEICRGGGLEQMDGVFW